MAQFVRKFFVRRFASPIAVTPTVTHGRSLLLQGGNGYLLLPSGGTLLLG